MATSLIKNMNANKILLVDRTSESNVDCNALASSTISHVMTNNNAPSSTAQYYQILTLNTDSGYKTQIAIRKNSDDLYIRYFNAATWSSWNRIQSSPI